MKRDNDNRNLKRERIIMITTSAMVLTVLTVTGAFVRNHNKNLLDDGYTIDFTALEDRADSKLKEITKSSELPNFSLKEKEEVGNSVELSKEVGSDEIKLPGILDETPKPEPIVDQSGSKSMSDGAEIAKQTTGKGNGKNLTVTISEQEPAEEVIMEEVKEEPPLIITETAAEQPILSDELSFSAENMIKPVNGETIIPYSMEHGTYFATLDQYKCNPAVIYGAAEGEKVYACTTGRVINVHEDAILGQVLVLDLGDGYQAIYGQLENVSIPIGGMVEAGAQLATVAAPTKYYVVEGSNLYFQILKDGKSIDPGQFF